MPPAPHDVPLSPSARPAAPLVSPGCRIEPGGVPCRHPPRLASRPEDLRHAPDRRRTIHALSGAGMPAALEAAAAMPLAAAVATPIDQTEPRERRR